MRCEIRCSRSSEIGVHLLRNTQLGAKQVGIIQSLLVTCKLQGINPYTYLVDVLQRIRQRPASKAIELTPRVWKEKFANVILKSDLDRVGQ